MTDVPDVADLLAQVKQQLADLLTRESRHDPVMIGIRTGGVWVAEHLHEGLAIAAPLGQLNISFYRDDFTRIGLHPQVEPTQLDTSLDNRHVILVDDVLHTGRTIRAAMNELFDYGRPASITLVVLVDRCGRELPVQPDVVGAMMELTSEDNIKLTGPQPLRLEVQSR